MSAIESQPTDRRDGEPGLVATGACELNPEARRRLPLLGYVGLLLIIGLNLAIRLGLERHDHTWYLDLCHTQYSLDWSLLLPVHLDSEHVYWITSSFLPLDLCVRAVGVNATFYLLNVLTIAVTFFTAWALSRSLVFALTASLGMAVGTQFHYSYALSGSFAMFLQVCYLQLITLFGQRFLTTGRYRWAIAFVLLLTFMSMGFDTWLNYFCFLMLAGAFLYWFLRGRGQFDLLPRVRLLAVSAIVLFLVWLPIKLHSTRHHFSKGQEDEVVFTYRKTSMIVEDVSSNMMTYVFMACTNYLPPPFVYSYSDYRYGTARILAEQHGYHSACSAHVANHHLFSWYYYAGIVFALYAYLLLFSGRRALWNGSFEWCIVAVLLLGIGAGSATHILIKFRPYMSVPSLSYKCMPSILAVTYLVAFALMRLREASSYRRLAIAVTACTWLLFLYSGLSRPALLSYLNTRVGLQPLHVDPLGKLRDIGRNVASAARR